MPRVPGQKETVLQEALDEIAVEQHEAEVWKKLEWDFGKLPESEQPTPPGAQAPAFVLQETLTEMDEGRMGEDGEAVLPREARGTMLVNLDFARLHVTTPEHRQVTSLVPVITLPPVQEQVVPEQVEMAAPLVQEQVAPKEVVPEQAAPEEVEMAEEEVLEEESAGKGDLLDDAQFIFGMREKNLMEDQRAQLEER